MDPTVKVPDLHNFLYTLDLNVYTFDSNFVQRQDTRNNATTQQQQQSILHSMSDIFFLFVG